MRHVVLFRVKFGQFCRFCVSSFSKLGASLVLGEVFYGHVLRILVTLKVGALFARRVRAGPGPPIWPQNGAKLGQNEPFCFVHFTKMGQKWPIFGRGRSKLGLETLTGAS